MDNMDYLINAIENNTNKLNELLLINNDIKNLLIIFIVAMLSGFVYKFLNDIWG